MPVVEYDFIIKATNARLVLTDEYRLKAAVTVSWGGYLKRAAITADCLFSVPIALIRFIGFLMLRIA